MTLKDQMKAYKRGVVLQTVLESGCNLSEAARRMGVHRKYMDYLLKEVDIDLGQLRKNFKTAGIMAEEKAKERTRKEMVDTYAHTHCMEKVPGGILGTRTCGNRINLDETICADCKARIEAQKKAPPESAESAINSQK